MDDKKESCLNKQKQRKVISKIKHRYGSDYQTLDEKNSGGNRRKSICDIHIDGA